MTKTFAAKLTELLAANDIVGNDVADACEMATCTFHRYKTGANVPSLTNAQRIAQALESMGIEGACELLLLPDSVRKSPR